MKNNLKFPKNFLWGAAASAPQTEGESLLHGKSQTTWDYWYGQNPELFDNEIGPVTTSNVYKLYKEDIKRMKDMNLNSYRTSISWARLLPDGKTVNQEAVSYYRDYFSELKRQGIKPIINLFHFDMPMWMMNKGGWINKEITDHFAYYAEVCAKEFGDIVKNWVTFNEPIVHVECSYMYGFHYPAIVDFPKAILAGYHTILAHAKAIQAMKRVDDNLRIGTILNITPVYGRKKTAGDEKATEIANQLNVRSFLDGMVKGKFSQSLINILDEHQLKPNVLQSDLNIIKNNTAQFLGVNYYQPKRVQEPSKNVNYPAKTTSDLYEPYIWSERVMNPYRGWEIYPEAILDIAKLIQNEYNNIPWFMSENGMGVADEAQYEDDNGIIQDTYRIEFIQNHLSYLSQAINEGANCFGYHMWTFVDCWSWLNGYRNRYGFYSVDILTQKRTPKLSSYWFRDMINNQREEI